MVDGEPHPLKPDTQNFLSIYRQSKEFGYRYNGNLSLTTNLKYLSEKGVRQALWSRAFVDSVFTLETVEGADKLLEPWSRWGQVHSQIWREYYDQKDSGEEQIDRRYEATSAKFDQVEIPAEIRNYQGDLLDDDLRSLAHWKIFTLTKTVKNGIDLIEEAARPTSLDTIFLVQRTLNKPFHPIEGLEPKIANKPSIRKVDQDGKVCIVIDFDEDLADFASEDPSSEQEWQRWNNLQLGTHIRYLTTDRKAAITSIESGIVQGFDLFGAGDSMLFGPSVASIGIIAENDATRFFHCPLVSQVRLEGEPINESDLNPPKPDAAVDVVMMGPQLGVVEKTYDSMETATDAGKRVIEEFMPPGQ